MKKAHFIVLLFGLTLVACFDRSKGQQNNNPPDTTQLKMPEDLKTTQTDPKAGWHRIDYDKTPVIKKVMVTDRQPVAMKQDPAADAITLGTYPYGYQLEVVEDLGDWYAVRDRITREYMEGDTKIESSAWEKVFVLKKSTGTSKDVQLIPDEINIISSLTIGDHTDFFEKGKQLNQYLRVDLIDQSVFLKEKASAINFFTSDTLTHQKKNGIIELPTETKVVKFRDKPSDDDDLQYYEYLGHFDNLNKFVVSGSYWESSDIRLVDRKSGKITELIDFPYLSPDQKYMISIWENPYESTADVEFYRLEGTEAKLVASLSYKNWMPVVEPSDIFWSKDGNLYLAVNHSMAYWNEDGLMNPPLQYLRMKVIP